MQRFLVLIFLLFLGQCLSGSTPGAPSPVWPQRIMITSAPVLLDSSNPLRRRIGALTFLGGWALSSEARAFGGLSAIDIHGNRVTALSDIGAIIRFRLGRFGNASAAEIIPVPRGCAPVERREDNDTEALAHDVRRQTWWIGIEWRNVLCRTNHDFSVGQGTAPPVMAKWRGKRGPESLLRLADGRFLIFAEAPPRTETTHPVILFDRDPVDPAAKAVRLAYDPPEGFDPTDAAQLPDGRILVMNRRFALTSLFTGALVMLDPSQMKPGDVLRGREIARFEAPIITDNYEGLSVTAENGQTIIWIVSDDNYMRWQRTLLLKFALN